MPYPIVRPLSPSPQWPPTLSVVIDTEEEFNWTAEFDRNAIATANLESQLPAQKIFDSYGIVPTYVVDYPVAEDATARAVLKQFLADGRCEIGAHLHPWVTPPHEGLIDNHHSFPGNLPEALERAKLSALTAYLGEAFKARPYIYKAGRYGAGPSTARILGDLGYRIDLSIMPWTDFALLGGPDFRYYTPRPFQTVHGIVVLPQSVDFVGALRTLGPYVYSDLASEVGQYLRLPGILARLGLLERLRLSPEGYELEDMVRQTRAALKAGRRIFQMNYHSSSLLPGSTPYVSSKADLDAFLTKIEGYVSFFFRECGGRSMTITAIANELSAVEARPPNQRISASGVLSNVGERATKAAASG